MVKTPRFLLLTFIALYVVLLFCEYLRPGFVSTALNPHWLWLGIVAAGAWVVNGREEEWRVPRAWSVAILLIFGMVMGCIVWNIGTSFGNMRFWLTLAVTVAPLAFFKDFR